MITKYDATWVGSGYQLPLRWARIKDIPPQSPGIVPIRLAFRFDVAYVLKDRDGRLLMQNGWLSTFDFYANEFGRLIGPQDFGAATDTKYEQVWRTLAMDKRADQLQLAKNI